MEEHQTPPAPRKLLDQVRDRLRALHYSLRTEDAYLFWIRRYVVFHGKRHPRELGGPEAEAFLTSLAVERRVYAGKATGTASRGAHARRGPLGARARTRH